jgi:cell wall-associated NlpC family hydrolase
MPARIRRQVALPVVAAAVLSSIVTLAPAANADHGPGPSANQVAAGKAAVARREAQVRQAAAAVERTRARLDRLGAAAEVAIEAYNVAQIKEQADRAAVGAATVVLDAASHRVSVVRRQVGRFAAAAYMSGGMSTVDAMLTADGPESMLYRVGTLEVISRSQHDVTQALDAARVYQVSLQQQATAALERAHAAAAAAARARIRAQDAVAGEKSLLVGLRQRQHQLAVLLASARQHASALERARLRAIVEARAAAAARKAAAAAATARQSAGQGGGATGDVSGTVSVATERQAVGYAESQIGKPYQWGAAGPDTYDCSGLTMWAYAHVGVHIDHYTGYQWQEGARISTSAVRPGDLVFFATDTSDPSTIHHVGMYIGNGEMVEAPHTGANVRISSMWRSDLIGAVRPYAN